jgi:hypothetical protein
MSSPTRKRQQTQDELIASADFVERSIAVVSAMMPYRGESGEQQSILQTIAKAVTCPDSEEHIASASSNTPTSRCTIDNNGKNAVGIVDGHGGFGWKRLDGVAEQAGMTHHRQ